MNLEKIQGKKSMFFEKIKPKNSMNLKKIQGKKLSRFPVFYR